MKKEEKHGLIVEILHEFGIDKYPKDVEIADKIHKHYMEFVEWLFLDNDNYYAQEDDKGDLCFMDYKNNKIVDYDYVLNYWLANIKEK